MKIKGLFILFFISNIFFCDLYAQKEVLSKKSFYEALASNDLNKINDQIKLMENLTNYEAFNGAMQLRKSEYIKALNEKISTFKSGRQKLENAISKDHENAEFRFLRLMIQEHAPKIVNYFSDIETDCKLIKLKFENLPILVKNAIIDYCKYSKNLKL